MADQDLPELQPGGSGRGKQIVFLFMSAVVAAVVIFLLGVSVGRGVRKPGTSTPAVDPGDGSGTTAASSTPPAATPTDLNYHDSLRGGTPADAAKTNRSGAPPATPAPVPPSAATTSAVPPPVDEAPPAKGAAAASGSKATPASTKPSAPPPAAHKTTGGQYSIQVGAFKSLQAAQSLMAQVKKKESFPVTTVTLPETEPGRFKVIVGPFATLDEANRVLSRLKGDGFNTILKR